MAREVFNRTFIYQSEKTPLMRKKTGCLVILQSPKTKKQVVVIERRHCRQQKKKPKNLVEQLQMRKQVNASYDYQPTAKVMVPCLKKEDFILNFTRTEV